MLPACLAVAWLFAPAGPARGADFTDVTTVALADTGLTRDKKGVAFVDYDGDGLLDICAVGEGIRAITLLHNVGGTYVDVTSGALNFPESGSGQTWGDYDNDGDPDLFLTIEEQPPHLFRNDGGGVFTEVTSGPLTLPAHGHSTAWLDYDRDGDLDLYAANLNQASRLFRNDGGVFVDATTDSLGVAYGDGVAVGDYDNDGDPDLYLVRFSLKPNLLLRNDGGGTFTDVTPPVLLDPSNGHSGAWADYDNDGDLDLYVVNANASNRLFRNDGPAGFTDVTTPTLALGAHSVGLSWGDYDNDGWLDLYVTQTDQGTSHMMLDPGGAGFVDVTSGPLVGTGTAAGVTSGDYDGDGDLDIYFGSYLSRPNKLLRNDLANGNHWLEVDLQGTVSNRSAIGARLSLEAGGMQQTREVLGCTGFRSQNALTVHFGLGSATQVTRLRVRWPSGILQDTSLAQVDQRIHMVERPTGVGTPIDPPGPRGLLLRAPAPNPARAGSRVDYELPRAMSVTLSVRDIQGRLVRVLDRGVRGPGDVRATWDGLDAAGARAPAGVYVCVLDTPDGRRTSRLALLSGRP